MLRKIIQIDEDLCTGCGLCVEACHEGAIGLIDGKARLLKDDYCDGLGDCLPACPTGAITFIEREAAPYDEAATLAHLAREGKSAADITAAAVAAEVTDGVRSLEGIPLGCPGARSQSIQKPVNARSQSIQKPVDARSQNIQKPVNKENRDDAGTLSRPSEIASWPIQIKLVPVQAPYFDGANLLIAADCTAFAYGDFHKDLMADHITLIGCPKLDGVDYSEKLAAILANNDILSVTCARMEVPCCGGLENATRRAIEMSGKEIPFEVVTISINGNVIQ